MSNSINVHASRTVANSVFEYIRLLGHDLIPSLLFFFYLLCTGSLFLDIIHHMLHHCTKAFHSLLQRLARIHHFHYLYFTRHLKFDRKYVRENRFQALPLELAIQICGSILGSRLEGRFIRLIELFKKCRITNTAYLTLPEVWYIGSEAELHPS
ncbi:unnamed protein product [Penicillium camemberti]|uniref:Str. FM013 n=1 Tax=Penicillium camemberti (strain FM 013) TaxID=1429867 RepID=A0A0G4PS49_PENC3|nr:unnamed protein product [Penicillium camemberti]